MKKTLSVVALLLSLLVVMSFGALSAYGEESSTAESSDVVSVESNDETSDVTSDETSDVTSDETSDVVSTDESAESSEESSEESSDVVVSTEDDDDSSFPWALTIFGAIVVIVAIVCFVSVKLNNKLGVWLKGFFRDYKSEIKKVTWPSKDITIKSTIVVIVCLVVSGIVIGLLDFGLAKLIELFRDLVSK